MKIRLALIILLFAFAGVSSGQDEAAENPGRAAAVPVAADACPLSVSGFRPAEHPLHLLTVGSPTPAPE